MRVDVVNITPEMLAANPGRATVALDGGHTHWQVVNVRVVAPAIPGAVEGDTCAIALRHNIGGIAVEAWDLYGDATEGLAYTPGSAHSARGTTYGSLTGAVFSDDLPLEVSFGLNSANGTLEEDVVVHLVSIEI